jgi:hypothetical protein
LKIVYSIPKRETAGKQAARFLRAIEGKGWDVRTAAYRGNFEIPFFDWTLDALHHPFIKNAPLSFESENFISFFEQIERFAPDLVISEMEVFSSYVAEMLGVPLWQIGSSIMFEGLAEYEGIPKYKFLKKLPSFIQAKLDHLDIIKKREDLLDASKKKLICSHLCDLTSPPKLTEEFEFVRPYHLIGYNSPTCYHKLIAISQRNDRELVRFLEKQQDDTVLFSHYPKEKFNSTVVKNINDEEEYICNIKNSDIIINQGDETALSDTFYNGKLNHIVLNNNDLEDCISSAFSVYMETGEILNEEKYKIMGSGRPKRSSIKKQIKSEIIFSDKTAPKFKYNSNAIFLHEKIEKEFCNEQ